MSVRQNRLCGNGYREEGEQCDGGLLSGDGPDVCCTDTCTYQPGAVCRYIIWFAIETM